MSFDKLRIRSSGRSVRAGHSRSLPANQNATPIYRERRRMALGKGPAWDTPAQIDGLPPKNWKDREGVTMRGTFSQCARQPNTATSREISPPTNRLEKY